MTECCLEYVCLSEKKNTTKNFILCMDVIIIMHKGLVLILSILWVIFLTFLFGFPFRLQGNETFHEWILVVEGWKVHIYLGSLALYEISFDSSNECIYFYICTNKCWKMYLWNMKKDTKHLTICLSMKVNTIYNIIIKSIAWKCHQVGYFMVHMKEEIP